MKKYKYYLYKFCHTFNLGSKVIGLPLGWDTLFPFAFCSEGGIPRDLFIKLRSCDRIIYCDEKTSFIKDIETGYTEVLYKPDIENYDRKILLHTYLWQDKKILNSLQSERKMKLKKINRRIIF